MARQIVQRVLHFPSIPSKSISTTIPPSFPTTTLSKTHANIIQHISPPLLSLGRVTVILPATVRMVVRSMHRAFSSETSSLFPNFFSPCPLPNPKHPFWKMRTTTIQRGYSLGSILFWRNREQRALPQPPRHPPHPPQAPNERSKQLPPPPSHHPSVDDQNTRIKFNTVGLGTCS